MNKKIIIILIGIVLPLAIVLSFFLYFKKVNKPVAAPTTSPTSEIRLPQPPINETKPILTEFVATILNYHQISDRDNTNSYYVTPKNFEEQLTWLNNKGYHFISYDKLYDAMANGGTLPKKPVVISFDDGVIDQYTNALPILNKFKIKAVFFIPIRNVGTEVGMSWAQIKDLSDQGMTIGSHAVTHAGLKEMTPKQIDYELTESKKIIEEHIGKEVKFFSYPKGIYTPDIVEAVKKAGYLSAVNSRETNVQKIVVANDLFEIPRMHAENSLKGIFEN